MLQPQLQAAQTGWRGRCRQARESRAWFALWDAEPIVPNRKLTGPARRDSRALPVLSVTLRGDHE
jgi:hypothetical protein